MYYYGINVYFIVLVRSPINYLTAWRYANYKVRATTRQRGSSSRFCICRSLGRFIELSACSELHKTICLVQSSVQDRTS